MKRKDWLPKLYRKEDQMNSHNEYEATIMIIDDTIANLEILEKILSPQGYRVLAFTKGEMALQAAWREPPDLILLDITMPEMDGFEVCRRLKDVDVLKDIPVIFISALNDTANKVQAFNQGGMDYVSKPFYVEEVLARIRTHINSRRLQLELKKYNEHLNQLVSEKIEELTAAQMSVLVAISNLAEFRDEDTGKHIERTQIICKLIAQKLLDNAYFSEEISNDFVENIYYSAALHDVGKIGISDNILLKPGKLTPDEFEIMKTHTTIGTQALESVHKIYPKNEFIKMGIDLVKYHHEKWDGSGYPYGIAGKIIPLSARIMALVDVYDALRSKRSYKKPFSSSESMEIIIEGSGKHFDPEVVEAFIELRNTVDEIYKKNGAEPQ